MVVREGLVLVAVGILIGVPATLAAGRLITSMLFGVTAADPLTVGSATGLLIMVAVLAGWIPSRRAAWVDPIVALRYE